MAERAGSGKADGGGGLAGITEDIAQFTVSSLAMGGAVGIATAAVSSFAEAFQFKAQLDATNASIAVQLTGVRDVGATYAEAQAYAARYKLTQEEMTGTLQASVGIMLDDVVAAFCTVLVIALGRSLFG
jgi:hypothetical protein